jgi:hypothetical protein
MLRVYAQSGEHASEEIRGQRISGSDALVFIPVA